MVGTTVLPWLRRLCDFHKSKNMLDSLQRFTNSGSVKCRHSLHHQRHQCHARTFSSTADDIQHIIKSPRDDVQIPDTTFSEFMFSKLRTFGDLTAVRDSVTGETYTYSDLEDATRRVASGLTKLGLKKGDRLLVFSTNCPEYFIIFLACASLGAITSTANPAYTAGELRRQLEHSGSTYIVTLPEFLPTVKEACDGSSVLNNQIKKTIVIGEANGVLSFRTLMNDDGKAFPDNVDVSSDDIITLPYSSGTTGLPKGVMLSHRNIIANVLQANDVMRFTAGEDRLLLVLPLFHIYGMVVSQFCVTTQGASYVTVPRFKPQDFLKNIEEHKITFLHLVPPLLLFLAKDPQVDSYDISSVHTIVCGAAPLGADLTSQLKSRVPATIIQAYGLTETSPVISYDTPPMKMGTCGPLVPNTEGKVVDLDSGKEVPRGETGEVCIRGPQVMVGYLDNQTATDNTIKEGWLHTGDIGYFDEMAKLVITDRLKELIKYKGFQVAPAELESVLLSHPGVQDAAVLGVADEEAGEVPKAFVVLKQGQNVSGQDIKDFVKGQVTPYKQLRGGVEFIEQIPKTPSGKILRRQLKGL